MSQARCLLAPTVAHDIQLVNQLHVAGDEWAVPPPIARYK